PGIPTLEARIDDIRAVLDATGRQRTVLFASGDAGPLAILFAATYPERTMGLALFNSVPRVTRSPETPWLPDREEFERQIADATTHWTDMEYNLDRFRGWAPSAPDDELEASIRIQRLGTSPGAHEAYMRWTFEVDVCDVLPLIRVPTLV